MVLTPTARRDIRSILRWSERKFGKAAAVRYEGLLIQAVRDITTEPRRFGARERPELLHGIMTYHLASSRDRVTGDKVKEPRHLIAYRLRGAGVEVIRILHDRSDLARHLPEY